MTPLTGLQCIVRACMQTEMLNEYTTQSKKRKASDRMSDLESSAASSGPHEAVALLASAFPPAPL